MKGCALLAASCALVALATGTARAYRTAADKPEFAGTERVRWAMNELHYDIASWIPPNLDAAAIEGAVDRAFAAWAQPDCSALSFASDGWTNGVASPVDGRVTVQFVGRDWAALGFDASAAASTDVSYVLAPSGEWQIFDADLFLNAESFTWVVGADPVAHDLESVVTHEVGHVLGLLHPCEVGGSDGAPLCAPEHAMLTMYPEYFGVEQRSLESDDVAGECFLYPPTACTASGCAAGESCTPLGCAAVCDTSVCAVGDRCGPYGCTAEPCVPGSCERGCADTCQTPGGADGDPCTSDLECRSAHCAQAGYCTLTCAVDECPAGYSCVLAECVATAGVFGAACESGSECQSGLCLLDPDAASVCTRSCTDGAPQCPTGYACLLIDATDAAPVCAVASGAGCSVGSRRSRGGDATWIVAAVLLGIIRRRRHGGER